MPDFRRPYLHRDGNTYRHRSRSRRTPHPSSRSNLGRDSYPQGSGYIANRDRHDTHGPDYDDFDYYSHGTRRLPVSSTSSGETRQEEWRRPSQSRWDEHLIPGKIPGLFLNAAIPGAAGIGYQGTGGVPGLSLGRVAEDQLAASPPSATPPLTNPAKSPPLFPDCMPGEDSVEWDLRPPLNGFSRMSLDASATDSTQLCVVDLTMEEDLQPRPLGRFSVTSSMTPRPTDLLSANAAGSTSRLVIDLTGDNSSPEDVAARHPSMAVTPCIDVAPETTLPEPMLTDQSTPEPTAPEAPTKALPAQDIRNMRQLTTEQKSGCEDHMVRINAERAGDESDHFAPESTTPQHSTTDSPPQEIRKQKKDKKTRREIRDAAKAKRKSEKLKEEGRAKARVEVEQAEQDRVEAAREAGGLEEEESKASLDAERAEEQKRERKEAKRKKRRKKKEEEEERAREEESKASLDAERAEAQKRERKEAKREKRRKKKEEEEERAREEEERRQERERREKREAREARRQKKREKREEREKRERKRLAEAELAAAKPAPEIPAPAKRITLRCAGPTHAAGAPVLQNPVLLPPNTRPPPAHHSVQQKEMYYRRILANAHNAQLSKLYPGIPLASLHVAHRVDTIENGRVFANYDKDGKLQEIRRPPKQRPLSTLETNEITKHFGAEKVAQLRRILEEKHGVSTLATLPLSHPIPPVAPPTPVATKKSSKEPDLLVKDADVRKRAREKVAGTEYEMACFQVEPVKPGYRFLEKGNGYLTKLAKRVTKEAKQTVYIVCSSATRTLGIQVPEALLDIAIEHERLTVEDRKYDADLRHNRAIRHVRMCLDGMFTTISTADADRVLRYFSESIVGKSALKSHRVPERLRIAAAKHIHSITGSKNDAWAEKKKQISKNELKQILKETRIQTWNSWGPPAPWGKHIRKTQDHFIGITRAKLAEEKRLKSAAMGLHAEEDEEEEYFSSVGSLSESEDIPSEGEEEVGDEDEDEEMGGVKQEDEEMEDVEQEDEEMEGVEQQEDSEDDMRPLAHVSLRTRDTHPEPTQRGTGRHATSPPRPPLPAPEHQTRSKRRRQHATPSMEPDESPVSRRLRPNWWTSSPEPELETEDATVKERGSKSKLDALIDWQSKLYT